MYLYKVYVLQSLSNMNTKQKGWWLKNIPGRYFSLTSPGNNAKIMLFTSRPHKKIIFSLSIPRCSQPQNFFLYEKKQFDFFIIHFINTLLSVTLTGRVSLSQHIYHVGCHIYRNINYQFKSLNKNKIKFGTLCVGGSWSIFIPEGYF